MSSRGCGQLGYHAYCGTGCEIGLESKRVAALLSEQFKTGMREGMRGAASFGAERSQEMVGSHSPLAEWKAQKGDDEFVASVKKQYGRLRYLFDATQDPEVGTMSLAVALATSLRLEGQSPDIFDRAMGIIEKYGEAEVPSEAEVDIART